MGGHLFKSSVLILPGLGNSGPGHWQTVWEEKYGFERIQQNNWDTPECDDWIATVEKTIAAKENEDIILVGHSLACCTIARWSDHYKRIIKGALLVAPSDTEGKQYPPGTKGFTPMPLNRLPFNSIVVTSSDDPYVTLARAQYFASHWGSKFIDVGSAGHINVASGFGVWSEGLVYLQELDEQ